MDEISSAATFLSRSGGTCAMSGAGVSAESDIDTFRDPGGLWDILDPAEVGTPEGLMRTLRKKGETLIPVLNRILDSFDRAEPNQGHYSLVRLEEYEILKWVITQNIDNLHREAGNSNVIEIHGNLFRMKCIRCGHLENHDRHDLIREVRTRLGAIDILSPENVLSLAPGCPRCGSPMRPDVVMFSESVQDLPRAYDASRSCDTMLVLGTSGMVYPATYLPLEAKKAGAVIIVINPVENAFSAISDIYIPMNTGEALPAILKCITDRAV